MITYTISSTQTGIAMTHFDVMEDTPGAFVLLQFGYGTGIWRATAAAIAFIPALADTGAPGGSAYLLISAASTAPGTTQGAEGAGLSGSPGLIITTASYPGNGDGVTITQGYISIVPAISPAMVPEPALSSFILAGLFAWAGRRRRGRLS